MIRFPEFEALGVSLAAFSEKSDGNCSLGAACGPRPPLEARAHVAGQCGVQPGHAVYMKQVHGTNVLRVRETDRGRGSIAGPDALGPADGLLTDVPGLPLAVLVADCVPLYLFDPRRRVGGVVHAGWRGTYDGVAARAVERVAAEWAGNPADLWAFLGPSAGPCCYEVSEELAQQFRDAGLAARGRVVDLWESNARHLAAAGVPRRQVLMSGICTLCDDRFFSHRRDASGGRNLGLLAV